MSVGSEKPLNAGRAAALSGLTSQMLDYLEREGVFEREQVRSNVLSRSRHHGTRREYTFRDIVVLKSMSTLLKRGVSVRRIRIALERFSKDEEFKCDRNSIEHLSHPIQYFVTDGTEIYFRKDSDSLVGLLNSGQQAFFFVLDLERFRAETSSGWPRKTAFKK